jgi:hypothetical protein
MVVGPSTSLSNNYFSDYEGDEDMTGIEVFKHDAIYITSELCKLISKG